MAPSESASGEDSSTSTPGMEIVIVRMPGEGFTGVQGLGGIGARCQTAPGGARNGSSCASKCSRTPGGSSSGGPAGAYGMM